MIKLKDKDDYVLIFAKLFERKYNRIYCRVQKERKYKKKIDGIAKPL